METIQTVKMNQYQTPLEDEYIQQLPQEVKEELYDTINNIEFIKRLISPNRPYAKDLTKDSKGRIIVDISNPHIIEDADYFRQPALHYIKHGCYTFLKPNSNPNSEYRKYWDEERRRCWEGYVRESDGEWVISMVRDRDILFELGKNKKNQILVGFAAESQNLIENAVKKLDKKNLDFIVANDISRKDIGFAVDENKVTIISKENVQYSLEKMTKDLVAKNIFDIILKKR